jgi:hypothetical protein
MLRGWDYIQLERGWALYIAGAALLSGGAVLAGLGRVIERVDALIVVLRPASIPESAPALRPSIEAGQNMDREPPPKTEERPVEVDRYRSGDVTYVMFSDGAVEVHGQDGARQRFGSLAELRERASRR